MPELTPSTRELARRIGVTETALRKAEAKGRIEREPDGPGWVLTRKPLVENGFRASKPVVLQRFPRFGVGAARNPLRDSGFQ